MTAEMPKRTIYLNGDYCPEDEARISVFDRGFLFADAVYEVTAVIAGRLVDFQGHVARLRRSLGALQISFPFTDEELLQAHMELIRVNNLDEGLVYLQVSRGAEPDRDFLYSGLKLTPTLVAFTQQRSLVDNPAAKRGLKVMTVPDLRWGRGDIKTVQLLYASMQKNRAKDEGVDDVWLVKDGFVTEGASSNAFIVKQGLAIITRNLSHEILGGITRDAVLKCAHQLKIEIEERPFTLDEARCASEAFMTSASSLVAPVVEIDGFRIGTGSTGAVTASIRQAYLSH